MFSREKKEQWPKIGKGHVFFIEFEHLIICWDGSLKESKRSQCEDEESSTLRKTL